MRNPARHIIKSIPGERVLLLQGPMGPFFRLFAEWLRERGVHVCKINFNLGDRFFYPGPNAIAYRGARAGWPTFLRGVLQREQIARVFLFGDCRPYHRDAITVCQALDIPVMVFEEGYIRPDYVTLEQGGVNGFSALSRDPAFYRAQPVKSEPKREPANTKYRRMALAASLYYWLSFFGRFRYPQYRHHRNFNPVSEGWAHIRGGLRKYRYRRRDRALTRWLTTDGAGQYFLVPLQTSSDSQILVHSKYTDVAEFIDEVIASFARHAPKDVLLVFKHHPMDRGHQQYAEHIRARALVHGIVERVRYAHELHLPSCLDHALGVVVVNSTVGLSALLHKVPVKTLGDAFYDMEGLTCQRSLDDFWTNPGAIDEELHHKFRCYVIEQTQLNGSFYGRFPLPHGHLDPSTADEADKPIRVARLRRAVTEAPAAFLK